MSNLSYGSITITDLTDIGQLSVYPTSNMPNTVIYNEDQNTYTPNWGGNSSHLVLTPVIYYAGSSLAANATGVSVVWSKKVGIASPTTITTNASTGESINSTTKVLTISKNPFGTDDTTICYIVTVTYVEPTTQRALTAEGQITFSLLKQVSTAKTCSIVGDSIFKYDENRAIKGATSITLTANYKNVTLSEWQYLNSSNNWVTHANSDSNNLQNITISHNDAGFINDRMSIKLITSDNDTYDIHTIMKLYDGTPGRSTITGVLSNEDQMIACQSDGTPISYDGAESYLTIYEGGTDVTSQWSIAIESSGVTYQKSTTTDGTNLVASETSGTNYRYVTVTGITADTGSITFTASKSGYNPIVKTFSLIKITQGANAPIPTIYKLQCSAVAVNKAATANTFNPSTVTINAYSKTGNNAWASYAGRFVIKAGSTNIRTSSNNESSYTITSSNLTSAVTNKSLTVELYAAGTTSGTPLDKQTIVITTDGPQGIQGQPGNDGKGAINVIIGNQADVIPCTSANKTSTAMTIQIPFKAYQGTQLIPCSVDNTALTAIAGVSPTITKQGTAANSYEGLITYTIPSGSTVSAATGTVTLRFTVTDLDDGNSTIVQEYRWARSTAATNGTNAVLLQLSTPSGNIFYKNGAASLRIVGNLIDGAQDKTSSVSSWVWSKYDPTQNTYVVDNSSSTSSITVNKNNVDGYASYKCQATYANKDYIQYYSLLDWTDPLQITVLCSFGDQITNGQGVGALYVIATQGSEEVDAIKTKTFSETAPSSPTSGTYYYKLDKTNKTIALMKYDGSTWSDVTSTEQYQGEYVWSFRDKDGNTLTTGVPAENGSNNLHKQKVIYIDGSFIDKKIIADVAVTL